MSFPFQEKFIRAKANIKYNRLLPFLTHGNNILDIGTGNGALCRVLQENGFKVQPLDVKNKSFFEESRPVIYDGARIPYPDNSFDIVLLITVLHHTEEPDALLKEASRVASRVIVMEDIYTNSVQKRLTFLADSIVNLEFSGHPHTNKTDMEWKSTFNTQGLKLITQINYPGFFLLFRQVTYVLEK